VPALRDNALTRKKKCKYCKKEFIPSRSFQKGCGFECEVQLALAAAERSRARRETKRRAEQRAERAEDRAKLDALQTRRYWIKQLKFVMHQFVRLRDAKKGCVSCGKPFPSGGAMGGAFDAGHFRSVGSAKHLEFDVGRNIHGQCKFCNRHLAGNPTGYRVGLIARIGLAEVEALEADQVPRKYSIDVLRQKKSEYAAKVAQLLKSGSEDDA
jgi:hypothetical protein